MFVCVILLIYVSGLVYLFVKRNVVAFVVFVYWKLKLYTSMLTISANLNYDPVFIKQPNIEDL